MKRKRRTRKDGGGEIQYNDASPMFLGNVIIEAKKKMDDVDKFNGTTYLLIGGSGSGKSTVLKHVFFNHVFLPQITPSHKDYIVICFTKSEMSDALKGIYPKVIMAPELDEEIIKWARQMVTEYGKEKYSFVFVLDDCIHIRNAHILEHCMLTFRNAGISTIISLQYVKLIPPGIRGTVYFACLMHCGKSSALAAIETFASDYIPGNNINAKAHAYLEMTEGYRFFFIDNLNHKFYYVLSNYECVTMQRLSPEESNLGVDGMGDFERDLSPPAKRSRSIDLPESSSGGEIQSRNGDTLS